MRIKLHITKLHPKKTANGYDFLSEDGRLAGRVERGMWGAKPFWCVLVYTNGHSAEPNHAKGGASSLAKAEKMILNDHVTQARFAPKPA